MKQGSWRIKAGTLPTLLAAMVLAALSHQASQAQSKDTLGTKVTATGDIITFEWDKKHPWDPLFSSQGAQLMAEYVTKSQGDVVQLLVRARPNATNEKVIHFRLPEALVSSPVGNVCLYIQLPNQRIVPIRKAGAGGETAHFQYAAWEKETVGRTAATRHTVRLQALRTAAENASRAADSARNAISAKGWQSEDACARLQAPYFSAGAKPLDVLPVTEHEDAARRVCVSRIEWNAEYLRTYYAKAKAAADADRLENLARAARGLVPTPDLDQTLLQYLRDKLGSTSEDLKERQKQLAELEKDWKKWANSADDYESPVFGVYRGEVDLQDVTEAVAMRVTDLTPDGMPMLSRAKAYTPADVAGYLGGSLEAYSRCVVDGQKQLATKLQNWVEMQSRAPELQAIAQRQLADSCHRQFSDAKQLEAQSTSLQQQYEAEQKTVLQGTGDRLQQGNNLALNGIACSVR